MKYLPEFLRNIDYYLLLNRPLIWRTRIHFLLFFSIVVNLAVFILGLLFPIGPQSIPPREWGTTFLVIALPLLAFGGLYWAYTQHKYKLVGGNFFEKLMTIGIYAVGVMALVFNLFFFHAVASYKIANAVETTKFYAEYDFSKKYSSNDENSDAVNKQYANLIRAYVHEASSINEIDITKYALKRQLNNTMRTIHEAKQFFFFDPANDDGFDALEFHLGMLYCFLLFIPMGLLLASFTGFKSLLITAFSQLLLFLGSSVMMVMETPFEANYVVLGMVLLLCLMGFFKNKKMEIGHFILLSMVPVSVLLFSADILGDQLVLVNVIFGVLIVVFTSIMLAGFAHMYAHFKAEPK